MIAALTCAMYMIGVSSACAQDVSNQKLGFDAKTVTPLVAIREIGLQSHVPIGIVLGANRSALCTGRVSFALHEVNSERCIVGSSPVSKLLDGKYRKPDCESD
jgi:hypothetical protein